MSFTTPRILKNVVVALALQTAYGSAASTSNVLRAQASSTDFDPGFEYLDANGTTGSHWPKDTRPKTAHMPKVKLDLFGSPKLAAMLWALALGGGNAASSAASDLTEAGDTGSDLSAWVFSGVRPGFNTSSDWKLYVKLTDENPTAGSALVQVYSDSGRTALVASGSHANNGTVTLAEANNSGLSGTVALAAPSASNLSSIVLTLVSVRPQISSGVGAYFTVWRDHGSGKGLERVIDCAVAKFTRKSAEKGPVTYGLEVVGSTYSFDANAGGTLTAGLSDADKEYYLHGVYSLETDVDSGDVSQHAMSAEFELENDLDVVMANSATATAIYKKAVKSCRLSVRQKLTDEAQVIALRGLADTYESVRFVDTFGGRDCTVLFDKVKSLDPKLPNTTGDGWDEIEHRFQVFEETATSPTAPIVAVIEL